MSEQGDLFPQELKEAKRYKLQKKKLSKVISEQLLKEQCSNEVIDLVMKTFKNKGVSNLFGIWMKIRTDLGLDYDSDEFKDLRVKVTDTIWLLIGARKLWTFEVDGDLVIGIKGEHSKKEYLKKIRGIQ